MSRRGFHRFPSPCPSYVLLKYSDNVKTSIQKRYTQNTALSLKTYRYPKLARHRSLLHGRPPRDNPLRCCPGPSQFRFQDSGILGFQLETSRTLSPKLHKPETLNPDGCRPEGVGFRAQGVSCALDRIPRFL